MLFPPHLEEDFPPGQEDLGHPRAPRCHISAAIRTARREAAVRRAASGPERRRGGSALGTAARAL